LLFGLGVGSVGFNILDEFDIKRFIHSFCTFFYNSGYTSFLWEPIGTKISFDSTGFIIVQRRG
jgi:hypothetical protein